MENKKLYLSADDCIAIIESFSHSQGFYGRLLSAIYETKENYEHFCAFCESSQFTDTLDLVLALEA